MHNLVINCIDRPYSKPLPPSCSTVPIAPRNFARSVPHHAIASCSNAVHVYRCKMTAADTLPGSTGQGLRSRVRGPTCTHAGPSDKEPAGDSGAGGNEDTTSGGSDAGGTGGSDAGKGGSGDGNGGSDKGKGKGGAGEPAKPVFKPFHWVLYATALLYVIARGKWRSDLKDKEREYQAQQEQHERSTEEWDRFRSNYGGRGGGSHAGGNPRIPPAGHA